MFGNHMIKMNNANEQKPLSRRQKRTRHKKFVRGMISMLASIFTITEHREVNYPVLFSTGAGGLNAQKYVDKTFIGDNTKDQIVTYTIKLWEMQYYLKTI